MTQSALADLLAAWLPAQRWFAGSGSKVGQVHVKSQVTLMDGEPELVHLMADASVGQNPVSYQVPVGIRSSLPADLTAARIGALPDGRIAYDATADPALTAELLRGIAAGREAGPLRFAAEPDAAIDVDAPARALPALASNTSVVFGNQAILKLLRRPFVGHHPDLEVPAALARRGSKLVAAPLGWIELADSGQCTPVVGNAVVANPVVANPVTANTGPTSTMKTNGEPTSSEPAGTVRTHPVQPSGSESSVLAILSVFFANSADGWSLATASLHEPEPDFSAEARLLGEATARLHTEMADAFGSSALSSTALAGLVEAMTAELTDALGVVPDLREYEDAVRACYASLTEPGNDVTVQRIHGDYHLAQVLGTDGGPSGSPPGHDDHPGGPSKSPRRWVVLDFEGEPSVPLARRRAFAPPLRDVAGMLRSFDYAARHEALRHPGDRRLAEVASTWVRRCQDAFCDGYADIMGSDPRTSGPLLRALTLQKAVYEAVYEARHRPDWLPIPLAAIAEASR